MSIHHSVDLLIPRTLHSITGRAAQAAHCWLIERPVVHRGLHGPDAPENSLAAFSAAIAVGHPIELDVRLLGDGKLAVFHDMTTERMTGVHGEIEHLDSAALRNLRLAGTSEGIPTLDDVLDLVQGRTPLLIELKTENLRAGDLEQEVARRLLCYEGPVAVQSFSPVAVAAMRRLAPGILRGQLSGTFSGIDRMPSWLKLVLRDLRLNGLSRPDFLSFELKGLPNTIIDRYRRSGMPLLAWTIDTPEAARRARALADNYIFEPFSSGSSPRPVPRDDR